MSDKQIISGKKGFFKRAMLLILKQTVASIICLSLALFMRYSDNTVLNNCSNALRLAINHNPGWEETVKEAFTGLKDNYTVK